MKNVLLRRLISAITLGSFLSISISPGFTLAQTLKKGAISNLEITGEKSSSSGVSFEPKKEEGIFLQEPILEPGVQFIGVEPSSDEKNVPSILSATEYEIVDPVTDMKSNGDGTRTHRFYQSPRLIYKDSDGVMKERPEGWNLFHEISDMRMANKSRGAYQFAIPFSDSSKVNISAGVHTQGAKSFNPSGAQFTRATKDGATVSQYKNIYPGVTVQFKDIESYRERVTIIPQKPKTIGPKDNFVFWENYSFPTSVKVTDGEGNEIAEGESTNSNGVLLSSEGGDRFNLSSAFVYDSKYPDEATSRDITAEPLSYTLRYNKKAGTLAVGTVVAGSYLLDSKRVYPVTIDPLYRMCSQNLVNQGGLSCSITDHYLRVVNGVNNAPAVQVNNDLFVGRWNEPGTGLRYTRHPVIYFNTDFRNLSGSVVSATLHLFYRNIGNGTSNNLDLIANRVTRTWDRTQPQNFTYTFFRSNISSDGNPSVNVSTQPTQRWLTPLNVTNSVERWRTGTPNEGFLVEQSPAWPSGTTPPQTWEDILLHLDSSRHSSNTSPYLEVTTQDPQLTSDPLNTFLVTGPTVSQGETLNPRVGVINNGAGTAPAGRVHLYLKKDLPLSYTTQYRVADLPYGQLASGQTAAVQFSNIRIPYDAPSGTYRIYWDIDATNTAQETNETDNRNSFTPLTVTPEADLTRFVDSINPTTLSPGESFEFAVIPQNSGTEESGPGIIRYYFNRGGASYDASAQVGSDSFSTITPGNRGSSETFTYTIPSTAATGRYFFSYWIDANDDTVEVREGNNQFFYSIDVVPPTTSNDVSVGEASIQNASGIKFNGDVLNVRARFRNLTTRSVPNAPYRLRIFDPNNSAFSYDLQNLSPGGMTMSGGFDQFVTVSGTIPSSVNPYVTYSMEVTIDPNNTLNDTNQSNNTTRPSETVYVERVSYGSGGGGGGGGPPPQCTYLNLPDEDCDRYPDVAEKTGGTGIRNSNQLMALGNSSQAANRMSSFSDKVMKNVGGDPVNTRTGAFEFTQTDFELKGRGVPIKFERTYNSKLPDLNNRLGYGWSFSYNNYIHQNPDRPNEFLVNFGGQLAIPFTTSDGGQTFSPPSGVFDTLERDVQGNLVYRTLEGIRYIFSRQVTSQMSVLEAIVDTNGNRTEFSYTIVRDVPLLTSVRDASGRQVNVSYVDITGNAQNWDKISRIEETVNTAAPRVVIYEYSPAGDLIHVRENRSYNGATEFIDRFFTYDINHQFLTYTDPRGTILTNDYDSDGRVIRQYEHNPRRDQAGQSRRIYEFEYINGAYPAAPSASRCTVTRNFRDLNNSYSSRDCFNSLELLIYREDGLQNGTTYIYTPEGLVNREIDPRGNETIRTYDARRRLTAEVLPNTVDWHTEIFYDYENNFNRLTRRTERVVPVSNLGAPPVEHITRYAIDANNGNILNINDAQSTTESFIYDAFGNVRRHIDKNGNTTNYFYDANGNYREEESIANVNKRWAYDVYGNVIRYTTPRNNVFRYEYDTRNNLRKQTDPLGGEKEFRYDIEDHLIYKKDEEGRETNYTYDTDINSSLLQEERVGATAAENIVTRFEYDFVGNKTKDVDALGRETTYSYDDGNRVTRVTTPVNTVNYIYDAAGNKTRETHTTGQRTDYIYDSRNRLLTTENFVSGGVFITQSQRYDELGRVSEKTDFRGETTFYVYDLLGRLRRITDALNNQTDYFYDNNGNKTGMLLPRAQNSSALRNSFGLSVHYEYDSLNRLIIETNAQNKETVRTYDQDSNLVRVIDRRNEDDTQNTHETNFSYDELNRKVSERDALNNSMTMTYDRVGNMLTRSDKRGNVTTFTYDRFNRMVSERDPAQNITRYTYDKVGNRLTMVYPDQTDVAYSYDAGNRLLTTTDELNGVRTFTYDAAGNKLSETDKRQMTTRFSYDLLNRLATETNPQNTVTTYTYDPNSNRLTEVTGGKTKRFAYDRINRITLITHPGAKTEGFAYDENNNLVSKTDGNNVTLTYTYDSLDRRVTKVIPAGATVRYAYDNWGNVTSTEDAAQTVTMTYDVLNRPVTEAKTLVGISGRTYTVTRAYDANSDVTSLTDAANREVTYGYDARRLLTSATYNNQALARYTYNTMARPTEITYQNGVKTTMGYDQLNRVATLEVKDASNATLFSNNYGYDAESNRTQLVESPTRTLTYNYDELEQLTRVDYSDIAGANDLVYAYDAFGNRTQHTSLSENLSYTTAAASHELTTINSNNGGLRIAATYDGNGSLTREDYTRLGSPLRTVTYSYDPENRLTGISYGGKTRPAWLPALPANTLEFAYSDDGNRVKKTVNGVSTYYVNNGLKVLNELTGTGDPAKSIVQGLEQIAEIDAQGTIKFLHQDVLGSTVLMTNAAGAVIQKSDYHPFGEIVGSEGTQTNKYMFTGQEYDAESELVYMNARYQNPRTGRFITRDIVRGLDGDLISRNPYIYTRNNPLKYTDPTGLWAGVDDLIALGAGAVIGLIGQGVGDIISGNNFEWENYVGAFLGGAVAGETALYAVPTTGLIGVVAAGASGSAVQNTVTQGLRNLTGKQEGFDFGSLGSDTVVGGAVAAIPVPGIKAVGVNVGKGSFEAVSKQVGTKLTKGQITGVSLPTYGKIMTAEIFNELPGEVTQNLAQGAVSSLLLGAGNSTQNPFQFPMAPLQSRMTPLQSTVSLETLQSMQRLESGNVNVKSYSPINMTKTYSQSISKKSLTSSKDNK